VLAPALEQKVNSSRFRYFSILLLAIRNPVALQIFNKLRPDVSYIKSLLERLDISLCFKIKD
jgi:hypothetical protein